MMLKGKLFVQGETDEKTVIAKTTLFFYEPKLLKFI